MKHFLLAACCIALVTNGFAQQPETQYSRSVFRGVSNVQPNTTAIAATSKVIQKNFPQWNTSFDKISGNAQDIFGRAIELPGSTNSEKAVYCINNKLKALGINAEEWQQTSNLTTAKASFLSYKQVAAGHTVVFSRIGFRFDTDGRMQRIQMRFYGQPNVSLQPKISSQDALTAAVKDLNITITSKETDADWVWFPIPSANGYQLHPAWHFIVKGTGAKLPLQLSGYVDALTGDLLYRTNEIRDAYNVTVKGSVYKDGTSSPATLEPLPEISLTIGSSTYITDTGGYYSSTTIGLPTVTSVQLAGKWSKVVDDPTGITPSVLDTVGLLGTTFTFPAIAPASSRHINAYYHVNRVHNFMKLLYPSFTGMDIQLPTNVDLTSGTCNAFYNGSSINFYAAGGGCTSFAEIGTVVYHEYGHGISDKYYNMVMGGTINNGALNEGNSDVWAMCVSHNPIIGDGAYPSGGYIRRYDIDPKVYPQDIQGEPHADGEIIAGAWWDVSVNLGNVDSMAKLFSETYNDVPDGPDGTEGDVYHAVLISALMNDDNDGNLYNGTPHFLQIVSAFAKHGIYLLGDATLRHDEVSNQKAGVAIPITVTLVVNYPDFFKDLTLYYSKRSTTPVKDSLIMTNTSGNTYVANIPAQSVGSILDYYFAIHDTLSFADAYFPVGYTPKLASTEVTLPYQFGVGLVARDSNTFETIPAAGWHIGGNTGDNATGGIWIQAVPVASTATSAAGSITCQTGNDHTTGTGKCLVTGNASYPSLPVGTADVDNGATTVISPVFDLSGYKNPIIEYYRWYSDNLGPNPDNDEWQVQMRDSPSYWRNVDATYRSDNNWRRRIFAVKEYFSVDKAIQFKFIASDVVVSSMPYNGQSVTEAAVDDFFIYDEEDSTSGVASVSQYKARIYPNPADNELVVELGGSEHNGNIGIYDLMGRKIWDTPLQQNVSRYTINTQSMIAGQYLLVIQAGKSIQTQKIVINH